MSRYGFKDAKRPQGYDDFTLSVMIERAQKNRSMYASPESQIELLRGWYGTGKIMKAASVPTGTGVSDAE